MIPAQFDYQRPTTLDEAIALLGANEDAKILSGGHSLIPAMKLRLAQPSVVIDIGRISGLNYIREENGRIAIGALTTHHDIEASALLKEKCPLLAEVAPQIGDVQVRNRGTIGGSLVHADPAADWPGAIIALDAEMEVVGPAGSRTIGAKKFFVDLFQTALQAGEILREVRVPFTAASVAYVKTLQRASGFAIAGAAVVVDASAKTVRVGINGIAAKPYRASAVESALRGRTLDADSIARASGKAAKGVEPLSDIHASAEFRAHLAGVNTRRALELAVSRL